MIPLTATPPDPSPTSSLPPAIAQSPAAVPPARRTPTRGTELDARGRQPPHPLVVIRSAVAELGPDEILQVRTQTEPIALVLALAGPDIEVSASALPDHTWRTTFRRR
jgi:TusA-related sulfurtransferase